MKHMAVAGSAGRCCALSFTLLAIAGCGETSQTVGEIKAASQVRVPTTQPATGEKRGAAGSPAVTGADAGELGTALGRPGSSVTSSAPDAGLDETAFPPPVPAPGCSSAMAAKLRPYEIYLLVDTNISLPLTGGWDNVRNGLASYVSDRCAAGVSVAVRYFGLDCTASTYATPSTPMGLLPENAATIKRQMPIIPFALSPTLPAVQGGLSYSRARAAANRDSRQIIMLVSDGFADFYCSGPEAIQSLFTRTTPSSGVSSPDLPIYVLALDVPMMTNTSATNPATYARFAPLDSIAQGGGTDKAHHIDLESSSAEFAKSMIELQHDAQPCDYVVPDSVRVDPSSAALAAPDGSGAQAPMQQYDSAAGCGAGYYFDDPKNPTWATLCPSTCSELKTRCAEIAWVTGCRVK
jgi:hypothetical protein